MAVLSKLIDPHLCIVFAYAPAGLGHLRVTKALYQGLPKDAEPILLPDPASSVKYFHRITTQYPLANKLFEWSQYGIAEDIVTNAYRHILQKDAHELEHKLLAILKQRVDLPKTLLIVATHFGIAHQISYIKSKLEKQANVKIFLVVCVTDDSPQKLWYVPHTDLLVTPSALTKKTLELYGKQKQLAHSHITVNPYPVSPQLTKTLDEDSWENKLRQAQPNSHVLIHIAVPISGAGAGVSQLHNLMKELHRLEPRVRFHVICKRTIFTTQYIRSWDRMDYITVYQSHSDRQIVELYEEAYSRVPMLLEITKPSEQSFKALLFPKRRGGVILLFVQPVGRQEYDNLHFLTRHNLIPSTEEKVGLYDVLQLKQNARISTPVHSWRGFSLPHDAKLSATYISRALSLRLFASMLEYKQVQTHEVSSFGVAEFWKQVAAIL